MTDAQDIPDTVRDEAMEAARRILEHAESQRDPESGGITRGQHAHWYRLACEQEGEKIARALLSRRSPLRAERDAVLVEALQKCADQFAFYAQQHRDKGTADGDAKAITNENFVKLCDRALKAEGI